MIYANTQLSNNKDLFVLTISSIESLTLKQISDILIEIANKYGEDHGKQYPTDTPSTLSSGDRDIYEVLQSISDGNET